jgi:hypothetical protein
MVNDQQALRDQLVRLMRGGQAFTPLKEVLAGITAVDAGRPVPGLPYTLWKLIEHLRLTLYDILEFSRDPAYQSPAWPEGYWPMEAGPASQAQLDRSIQVLLEGLEAMITLVQDLRAICLHLLPMERGSTCSARPCWWPSIMRITWVRWWCSGGCWASGRKHESLWATSRLEADYGALQGTGKDHPTAYPSLQVYFKCYPMVLIHPVLP